MSGRSMTQEGRKSDFTNDVLCEHPPSKDRKVDEWHSVELGTFEIAETVFLLMKVG